MPAVLRHVSKPHVIINLNLSIAPGGLYSKITMTDSQEKSHLMAEVDRRSGRDRRQFSYTAHIPERRSGKDRRRRKRIYMLNIEDDGTLREEEVRLKNS